METNNVFVRDPTGAADPVKLVDQRSSFLEEIGEGGTVRAGAGPGKADFAHLDRALNRGALSGANQRAYIYMIRSRSQRRMGSQGCTWVLVTAK
jgi:hypothetical protein